ncbi:uncharacterized protein TNCV_1940561 [Trichonephila clavipes]|nr:uncharacterized protein TNCV_1940561 [Trichonephila clavipes]
MHSYHNSTYRLRVKKIELREDLKSRRGLAVSLEIICHNCGESTSTMSSKISNKCYDVNLRLTYGIRAIGKSEDSMNAAVHEAVIANDNNSNIAVAVDGTWHKRGYSSLNGVVCATSLLRTERLSTLKLSQNIVLLVRCADPLDVLLLNEDRVVPAMVSLLSLDHSSK